MTTNGICKECNGYTFRMEFDLGSDKPYMMVICKTCGTEAGILAAPLVGT